MKQTQPLPKSPETLGPVRQWQVEWEWVGQKIHLRTAEDAVTVSDKEGSEVEAAPELIESALSLPPGTCLEGVLTSGDCQHIMIWDCTEFLGADLRTMPLYARQLQAFPMVGSLDSPFFRTSEPLQITSWDQAEKILSPPLPLHTQGWVIKKTDGVYQEEGPDDTWWTLVHCKP